MKKIKQLIKSLCTILLAIGLFASFIMPVYLIVATIKIKEILPDWFLITNYILAGLMIFSFVSALMLYITDKS